MEIVVLCVVCIFLGIVIGVVGMLIRNIGILRVDRSEQDEPPMLFLQELNCYPEEIAKRKYVTLRVLAEDFIPRD